MARLPKKNTRHLSDIGSPASKAFTAQRLLRPLTQVLYRIKADNASYTVVFTVGFSQV